MNTFKKPDFRLQRQYNDGTKGEPEIYSVKEVSKNWQMGRRGFVLTGLVLSSALTAQFSGMKETLAAKEKKEPNIAEEDCRGIKSHFGIVSSVVFSPDAQLLASGSADGTVKLWNIDTGEIIRTFKAHEAVKSVAFSPNGKLLASGCWDSTIELWNVDTGEIFRTLTGSYVDLTSIAFSPDGKLLASFNRDHKLRLWEVKTGKIFRTLKGHEFVKSVAFSPNGKVLASGSFKGSIVLWDIEKGKPSQELQEDSFGVNSVAFSPDSKILASGGLMGIVELWEVDKGKHINTLKGHAKSVKSVVFSPEGKILASGGDNIKLWEVDTGKHIQTFKSFANSVESVAFSPNGKFLASGNSDFTLMLWDVDHGNFLSCLFDPKATSIGKKVITYQHQDRYGRKVLYTLPCGSSIPPGSTCTCNCVPGSKPSEKSFRPSGGSICTCDKICTCVPIV